MNVFTGFKRFTAYEFVCRGTEKVSENFPQDMNVNVQALNKPRLHT